MTAKQDIDKLRKNFGNDIRERLSYRLPGTGPVISPFAYTSEEDLREQVEHVLNMPQRTLSAEQLAAAGLDRDPLLKKAMSSRKALSQAERASVAERWLLKLIESARRRGRLMTPQQLADWRLGRKLGTGDRARYIGPDRDEVTQAQLIVPRPNGQLGIISGTEDTKAGRTIVFYPDEPVEPIEAPGAERQYVALEVREYTPGWLCLERVPPTDESTEPDDELAKEEHA